MSIPEPRVQNSFTTPRSTSAARPHTVVRSSGRGVRMTVSSLICTLFLLAVALPLTYMAGVMVGRYYPVRQTPLEAMQVQDAPQASAGAVSPESDGAGNSSGGEKSGASAARDASAAGSAPQADAASAGEADSARQILDASELSFSRVLRSAPGEKVQEGSGRRYSPAVDKNATQPKMPPGMSPAVIEGPPEPPAQKAEAYDFAYQVATCRTLASAEELRLKIEEKGYRTKAQRRGRLIVILVLARGPESTAGEIRSAMMRMGLGEPIERSRRPVFRPAQR